VYYRVNKNCSLTMALLLLDVASSIKSVSMVAKRWETSNNHLYCILNCLQKSKLLDAAALRSLSIAWNKNIVRTSCLKEMKHKVSNLAFQLHFSLNVSYPPSGRA
jgi:hypothetical protein